jgi:hypothetical protein
MMKNSQQSQDRINRRLQVFLRGLVRSAIGVLDWHFRRQVQSGKCLYRIYCFAKD